jgi:protein-S-isoprenylcysteine O-methyltransferase Ste14
MTEPERSRSRIADNRLAAAVVVGSICLGVVGWLLFEVGLFDDVVLEVTPPADAAPLYLLAVLIAFGLVVWSWQRVLSFFR